jgi:hypothetical protein
MKKLFDTYKLFWNVLMRIVAAFTASALGVIGAGAIAHISTVKAMAVAGLTATATIVEKLARGFMDDGKLTLDEINAAFAAVDTQAKTVADLQVEARQSGQDITVSANPAVAPVAAPVDTTPVAPAPTAEDAASVPTEAPVPPVLDPNYN